MADKAIGDHLMGLLVYDFPHLWPRSVWWVGDGVLVGIFEVSSILNQAGFAIIAVVLGEDFFVFPNEQVCELFLIRSGIWRHYCEIDFQRLRSGGDISTGCKPFFDMGFLPSRWVWRGGGFGGGFGRRGGGCRLDFAAEAKDDYAFW